MRVRWPVLSLVLVIVFVGAVTVGYVLATLPGGVDSRCYSAGPTPVSLGPEWEPLEVMTVTGSVQWIPFGRACTWTAAAGAPSLAVSPGVEAWPLTIILWGSLTGMVVVALVGVLLRVRSHRTPAAQRPSR